MCRWLAYAGPSIPLEAILFRTEHSLIDQSLAARSSPTTTNGDGFGLGWFGDGDRPGLYRHTQPAWNDANLRDLAAHLRSHLFLAHVRAATGTAVQQTNCHPFRHGPWIFVHNGVVDGFPRLRRRLALEIAPDLYPAITGTTDSEILFLLALTLGLDDDPAGGLSRMIQVVERIGREEGIEHPLQMTVGATDGQRLVAGRYSTERRSRTLFHSRGRRALQWLCPDLVPRGDEAVLVVSEPLTDLADDWVEIPESTVFTLVGRKVQRARLGE